MRQRIISLDTINSKEKLIVVSHTGEEEVSRRLSDMGLVDGVEFEVMIPGGAGSPYLIKVDNTRIAIENDLARKLNVIPVKEHIHGFSRKHRYRFRKGGGLLRRNLKIQSLEGSDE
jgi:Fe2+ transport system protein FeoA